MMSAEQIIDIDVGNSTIKWRLMEGLACLDSGRVLHQGWSISLKKALPLESKPVRARLVSVAGPPFNKALSHALQETGVKRVDFAEVKSRVGRVRCGYTDITQLGVDRWMAILAASEISEDACAVVDVGSAITIDFINADKQHLGGYIVPGWQLLYEALYTGTAIHKERIPKDYDAPAIVPGSNTLDAIGMGRLLSCVTSIEYAIDQFAAQQQSDIQVVCAGGDARPLMPHLKFEAQFRPNLVLDGLAIALG